MQICQIQNKIYILTTKSKVINFWPNFCPLNDYPVLSKLRRVIETLVSGTNRDGHTKSNTRNTQTMLEKLELPFWFLKSPQQCL